MLNIFKVYKSMLWQIYIILNDLFKNIRFVYILILQHPIRPYIGILRAFIHPSPLRVYMYIEIILHVTWSDGRSVGCWLWQAAKRLSEFLTPDQWYTRYKIISTNLQKKPSFYSILVKRTNNNYLRSKFNELVQKISGPSI